MGDWSLIGVRFALYVTLAALFGLAAFSLYGLRARERGDALAHADQAEMFAAGDAGGIEAAAVVRRMHIAEALSYRRVVLANGA